MAVSVNAHSEGRDVDDRYVLICRNLSIQYFDTNLHLYQYQIWNNYNRTEHIQKGFTAHPAILLLKLSLVKQ